VRVSFATNDERTAKRVSDALGTATEMRAMKNYAGHRLSPWLGHLMVSRQETARPLLTPGEVMQLPPAEELVLVSGSPPIRAAKVRYFEDQALNARVGLPPAPDRIGRDEAPDPAWSARLLQGPPAAGVGAAGDGDVDNAGLRREPELPDHEEVVLPAPPEREFEDLDEGDDQAAALAQSQRFRAIARQAALDPGDEMDL